MDSDSFKSISEEHHKKWLSPLIEVPSGGHLDIDFYDEHFGIELKSRNRDWYQSFAVHHYQVKLFRRKHIGKELFWAFLLYDTLIPIPNITRRNIEGALANREVWFLGWDWIKRFPVSHARTGPYVYVNKKYFPPQANFKQVEVEGGQLYVPIDSSLDRKLCRRF